MNRCRVLVGQTRRAGAGGRGAALGHQLMSRRTSDFRGGQPAGARQGSEAPLTRLGIGQTHKVEHRSNGNRRGHFLRSYYVPVPLVPETALRPVTSSHVLGGKPEL